MTMIRTAPADRNWAAYDAAVTECDSKWTIVDKELGNKVTILVIGSVWINIIIIIIHWADAVYMWERVIISGYPAGDMLLSLATDSRWQEKVQISGYRWLVTSNKSPTIVCLLLYTY